jgi:hypothetical protein
MVRGELVTRRFLAERSLRPANQQGSLPELLVASSVNLKCSIAGKNTALLSTILRSLPPQRQAWSPSHGRSGWASQTQPQSSHSRHRI